jgi:hypothetical protein
LVNELSTRLFTKKPSENVLVEVSDEPEPSASSSSASRDPEISYAEKVSAQFRLNLENIGLQKRKTSDIVAEMNLASVTGDLTDRLQKLLKAVESVQASSIESERAFSIAGRFVTKIRNRLGDKTLDSYCFAKQQFLNELRYQPVRRKYSAAE